MKQILISIKPKWVAKILNGEKTLEIRKSAPKEWVDYLNGKTDKNPEPMTVYIYCTKGDYIGYLSNRYVGKVVARFALRNVYAIYNQSAIDQTYTMYTKYLLGRKANHFFAEQADEDFLRYSCLFNNEVDAYLKGKIGYAWHISDLEIFDEPKDLEQFDYPNPSGIANVSKRSIKGLPNKKHPPQSWCYVEER